MWCDDCEMSYECPDYCPGEACCREDELEDEDDYY